jgi:hypothetical protein
MWTRSKNLTKGFIKKIKFFESKPSVLFLLLHNELTFICAKKEKEKKKKKTKQNKIKCFFPNKLELGSEVLLNNKNQTTLFRTISFSSKDSNRNLTKIGKP